jgi:hypothetical protein
VARPLTRLLHEFSMSASLVSDFSYDRLGDAGRQIRLVAFEQSNTAVDGSFTATIDTFELDCPPEYMALSYV